MAASTDQRRPRFFQFKWPNGLRGALKYFPLTMMMCTVPDSFELTLIERNVVECARPLEVECERSRGMAKVQVYRSQWAVLVDGSFAGNIRRWDCMIIDYSDVRGHLEKEYMRFVFF